MLYEYADPGCIVQFSPHTPAFEGDGPLIRMYGAAHFDACAEYVVCRDGLDQLLFAYTLAGEGRLRTNGQDYSLSRGKAFLIDCNTYHEYATAGEHWDFLWFHFDGELAQAYSRRIWDRLGPVIEGAAECIGLWQSLFELSQQNSEDAEAMISGEIYRILTSLYTSRPRDSRIERVVEFIEQNFERNITVEDMARQAFLSPYYFQRKFREQTGQTPHEYLNRRRVAYAQHRLVFTEDSIASIAESAGFCSSSHCSSVFHKITGYYPSEYRSHLT